MHILSFRVRRPLWVVFVIAGVAGIASYSWPTLANWVSAEIMERQKATVLGLTSQLPEVDKVILQSIVHHGDQATDVIRVEPYREDFRAAKPVVLTGGNAKRIGSLWRNLEWGGPLAVCHDPDTSICFFHNGKLLLKTTISWSCWNTWIPYPFGGSDFIAFNRHGKNVRALQDAITEALHQPDAR